jgi:hypothetical protein
MNKIWEKEACRIEHEEDATITFSIALHGKHAWENAAGSSLPLPQHRPRVGD